MLEGQSYAKIDKVTFFNKTIKKLIAKGGDSSFFAKIINDDRVKFDDNYVKINITNIFKKNDYSPNYNQYSISKVRSFIDINKDIFSECSKIYNIPQELIASILWIETKNGSFLGTHHIVSVFLSASMAEEPEFISKNYEIIKDYKEFEGQDSAYIIDFVKARASKKANWAIEELLALEKMSKIHAIDILQIYGSWAGAFGFSQFIPSSYINYSVDGDNDGIINLFSLKDAVFSIANYLKQHGWSNSYESQKQAVYAYNNSKDYVNAVLTLSKKIAEYDSVDNFLYPKENVPFDSL